MNRNAITLNMTQYLIEFPLVFPSMEASPLENEKLKDNWKKASKVELDQTLCVLGG